MSGGVELERLVSVVGVAQNLLGNETSVMDTGGGGGGGSLKREVHPNPVANKDSHETSPSKKQRRIRKYNHHHHHHSHNRKHLGKRIRRNTQPAPNNTNEFLMQEHDHLFHLDLDNEEWDIPAPADSDELNLHVNQVYSSSEDDQDYLSREFSATYDVVNAERLSLMSKAELISEYQLLEERVESLERKLKSALRSKPEKQEPVQSTLSSKPISTLLNEGDKVLIVHGEVARLKDENRRIRADNKSLRKLMYSDIPGSTTHRLSLTGPGGALRADSTDSGGGSGSSSDIGLL